MKGQPVGELKEEMILFGWWRWLRLFVDNIIGRWIDQGSNHSSRKNSILGCHSQLCHKWFTLQHIHQCHLWPSVSTGAVVYWNIPYCFYLYIYKRKKKRKRTEDKWKWRTWWNKTLIRGQNSFLHTSQPCTSPPVLNLCFED